MSADLHHAPDLRDLVRVLFKRLWAVPLVTAVCLGGGVLVLEFMTPLYESRARLLAVGTPRVESAFYNPLPTRGDAGVAATIAEAVKSRDVLREVVLSLKLHRRDLDQYDSDTRRSVMAAKDDLIAWVKKTKKWVMEDLLKREPEVEEPEPDPVLLAVEALEENVTVEAVEKTDLVVVTVLDPDAQTAARIGNAIAYAYVLFNLRQQAAETAQKYGPEHPVARQLQDNIGRVRAALANPVAGREPDFGAGSVKIVEHAYPSTEPKKPKKDYVLGGSLGGGFLGSFFIIFLLDLLDPTFRGPEDLRRVLGEGVPVLGAVPHKAWRSGEPVPPAVTSVARHIQSVMEGRPLARRMFFASADKSRAGEALVNSLALCFEHGGEAGDQPADVLLVRPDRAAVPSFFKRLFRRSPSGKPGPALNRALALVASKGANGAGAAPATLPVQSDKCRAFLDQASRENDCVLIAGTDYSHRAEFLFLSSMADVAVVIVNEGETRRKAVAGMLHALKLNGVTVIGAVLNNQRHPLPGFLYHAV